MMFEIAAVALAQEVVAPIVVSPSPTFTDQIVPIAVAVATAIGIVMAAVLPAIKGVRDLVTTLKADVKAQGESVSELTVNTNSISEKLRQAIEEGALARGEAIGVAKERANPQQSAQIRNDAPVGNTADPIKVEVANPKPVKVTETKT